MSVLIAVWAIIVVVIVSSVIAKRITAGDQQQSDIIFQPRVIHPGERLGEYRRKRARVDPQKPEGNEVDWIKVRADKRRQAIAATAAENTVLLSDWAKRHQERRS